MTPEEQLTAQLAGQLSQTQAAECVAALMNSSADGHPASVILGLLAELRDVSEKVAKGAIEALPELHRRREMEIAISWLDLGVALAVSSGAAGLKYMKESPVILGLLEGAERRRLVLRVALELAESDPNVALEFFRHAPVLLAVLPAEQVNAWAEVGLELARWDYLLGIEFFRQGPAVARVVPLALVRDWVAFGMKLVTQNSLGTTDYLGTLEFFRTSPMILGDIENHSVRRSVIQLGSALADRDPHRAIAYLAESPVLLRRLPSETWQERVLQYGGLVAERDAEATLAYFRRCPEVLALAGGSSEEKKFEGWFRGGMEALAYSPEGARAYFALETRKALVSLEQAMSGVSLRQVARTLKLFIESLCGTDVMVQSLGDSSVLESTGIGVESIRPRVSPDGKTIGFPSLIRRYPTRGENIRLYMVMAAHEAGHLEFGTYQVPLDRLADLERKVRRRYARPARTGENQIRSLGELFRLYPHPLLVRDLWTVLEDARVEARLCEDYPGLRQDLAELAREAVRTRSLTHGLTVREMVVDALLVRSIAHPGTVVIPEVIREIVERLWALCQAVLAPGATAEEIVRTADRIYVALDEFVARVELDRERAGQMPQPEPEIGTGPQASESLSKEYRPVTNWAYRGAMNPELVTTSGGLEEGPGMGAAGNGIAEPEPRSPVEELLTVGDNQHRRPEARAAGERVFLYDEWDGRLNDYRTRWCRVIERLAPEGTPAFAEAILSAHGPSVRALRRCFEGFRPPGLRRVPGQSEGEDLDVDAVVRRMADRAAGSDPSDRIYIRREKREREVAAAFLVDLSGSTSRQIGPDGRRVIDVEKEGLILLCEALDALGDQYAVYGYSGQGRYQVDFLVFKDFDEPASGRVTSRVSAAGPLHQNRDGAAIRHAARKLLAQNARVRLLMLISDGRPLDDAYADEYALEDTKQALREARTYGVKPFCITVDRDAGDYLRRMYGEVRFVIVDHAGMLPERLPLVYRRLTA